MGNIKEDEFIVEFTDLYCDLNYLHPFREGNGRIQRLFLSMLVNSLEKSLNFSQIDADYLMIATIKSVSGDIFMLRDIFREYIAQKLNQKRLLICTPKVRHFWRCIFLAQNCIKVQKTAINAVINVDFFRILLYNKVVKEILNSIKGLILQKHLA